MLSLGAWFVVFSFLDNCDLRQLLTFIGQLGLLEIITVLLMLLFIGVLFIDYITKDTVYI